jgi:acetyl esterase
VRVSLDRSSSRVLARLRADPPPDPATPDGLRALVNRIAEINGPGPQPARESDRVVPGTGVHLRLLGVAEPPSGLIVMLGLRGWVAGAPGPHETVARKLAERTSCDVALIDFRRAPEHPYPAPADDVYAATRWLWHARPALGHGDTPMMVLGEGMGAALAAGTVHRALRDPDGPRFALQLLICPVLDACAGPGVGGQDHVTDTPLSRAAFDRLWDCYLPDPGLRSAPDASPGRATDWHGTPPTLVITAGHDAAAGEGTAFAARLRAAHVPVAERHFEDQMHGFFGILPARLGERAFQHVVRAVRGYTARAVQNAVPPAAELAGWLDRVIK